MIPSGKMLQHTPESQEQFRDAHTFYSTVSWVSQPMLPNQAKPKWWKEKSLLLLSIVIW